MDKKPIGMFDSGVGGLTVLEEIRKILPQEDIIYLGDTKRFPYGSKSKEAIIDISKKCTKFLEKENVKMIIIACGTATSQALEEIKKVSNIPVIGIIEPTVNYLMDKNYKKIGIIATNGTIKSGEWERKLKEKIKNIDVISKATPLLAPMAEQGWTENEVAKQTIKEYMKDLKDIDTLILGCTHYPLFKSLIQNELGKDVKLINTGEMMANYIKKYLHCKNIQNDENNVGNYQIYLTDLEQGFINVAKKLLKDNNIEKNINKTLI